MIESANGPNASPLQTPLIEIAPRCRPSALRVIAWIVIATRPDPRPLLPTDSRLLRLQSREIPRQTCDARSEPESMQKALMSRMLRAAAAQSSLPAIALLLIALPIALWIARCPLGPARPTQQSDVEASTTDTTETALAITTMQAGTQGASIAITANIAAAIIAASGSPSSSSLFLLHPLPQPLLLPIIPRRKIRP